MNLYTILLLSPQGISTTASMLVGQALGRGWPTLARAFADLSVTGVSLFAFILLSLYVFVCTVVVWGVSVFRLTSGEDSEGYTGEENLRSLLGLTSSTYITPLAYWYNIPSDTSTDSRLYPITICVPVIFFGVFLPEGVSLTCSGVLRACGRWRLGVLAAILPQLLIGFPLAAILAGKFGASYGIGSDQNPHDSDATLLLLSPWLGVSMGCFVAAAWFLKLVSEVDFGERTERTLLRLDKDENRDWHTPAA